MSSDQFAVKVENLGKRYLVPHRGDGKRSDRLRAHLKEFLPFIDKEEKDYFWALKDLSFEVRQGEILGILGQNGSGKSTLLKILSGVSPPTTGRALLRGKIASLLEVGTGFHPDLTGRENVFMSGALLGIGQMEIRAKFDQIVDFSGIERFIDMPVKRYSSGMYVRLAYAVASMLRSDILILDEVMAVGDAAFREKSQENIEKIANDGCTVLFVSHSARTVTSICKTGMILDAGQGIFRGTAKDAVATYLRRIHHFDTPEAVGEEERSFHDLTNSPRMYGEKSVFQWVSTHLVDGTPSNKFSTGKSLLVRIGYQGIRPERAYFSISIQNEFAERMATIHSTHVGDGLHLSADGVVECLIEDLRLGEGVYRLMLDYGAYGGSRAAMNSIECIPNAALIHVDLDGYFEGVGLDAFQGAAHKSGWKTLGVESNT